MTSPELIAYIHKQTAAGVSIESITKSLISNGWSLQDIHQAFTALPAPTAAASPGTGVKIFLSIVFITASAVYAFFQYAANPTLTVVAQVSVSTAPPPKKSQTSTPAPQLAPKPAGEYADGSYTGSPADAYYGTVKIQAIIQGGKLTAVNFLSYPNDRNTSRYINAQAMPQLKTEAIQAQSANVDGVSGATDTSQAFIQSLGSALAQAKN